MNNENSQGVLLVDMQDFFLIRINNYWRMGLINSQREVLSQCAERDIPVGVLETVSCGKTVSELRGALESVPRVEVFGKGSYNGFAGTKLGEWFGEWGVRNVFVMGIYASKCVYETAQGAKGFGLKASTSRDVVSDYEGVSSSVAGLLESVGKFHESYQDVF